MKLSATAIFLAAISPAMAFDYTLTCARDMYIGPAAQDYFNRLYTRICIESAKCAHSSQPILGSRGALVNGGCTGCPDNLNPNLFGDCLLAKIKD
ncbi:hypothetical protein CKAH01_12098 [Colletotrichum kahawae]|uniref:Uncharacterized protein n=1 Tax=Colletotrichum kahawae TaxID=34407 RepID=A0AAD9YW68_COLKA|nr:hypothetical protein CKAH01_12098 [Colletotrichum kahawae]